MERSIAASEVVRASTDLVRTILRDSPEAVFGGPAVGPRSPARVFETTIAAHLGAGTTVEQAVELRVGPMTADESDRFVVTLSWDPRGRDRLLPSFCGELTMEPSDRGCTRATLRGTYCAPLGVIGRFGDAVVGHRVARQSLASFARHLAQQIDREALRRRRAAPLKPAPYNEDLRPHSRSEHCIG